MIGSMRTHSSDGHLTLDPVQCLQKQREWKSMKFIKPEGDKTGSKWNNLEKQHEQWSENGLMNASQTGTISSAKWGANWHGTSPSATHQGWVIWKAGHKPEFSQLWVKKGTERFEYGLIPQGIESNMPSILPSTYLTSMCFKKYIY